MNKKVLLGTALVAAAGMVGALRYWIIGNGLVASGSPTGLSGGCPPPEAGTRRPVPRSARPAPGPVTQLALGGHQSCALLASHEIWCWGRPDFGPGHVRSSAERDAVSHIQLSELYDDADTHSSFLKSGAPPHMVEAPDAVTFVAQARFALCSIDQDALLRCRRVKAYSGQIASYEPWLELTDARTVTVGNDFACAVRKDSAAWCWGSNDVLRLKVDASQFVDRPTPVLHHVQSLALGLGHICAILAQTGGTRLRCVGDDSLKQLGHWGDSAVRVNKLPEVDDGNFVAVAAGIAHTCALTRDGQVWCWGDDRAGQVSAPPNPVIAEALEHSEPAPVVPSGPYRVASLPAVVEIKAGGDTSCARTNSGEVYCWGRLGCGLPLSSREACPRLPPTRLASDTPAVELEVGERHVCVRGADGQVACAGDDEHHQLGAALEWVEKPTQDRGCPRYAWAEAEFTRTLTAVAW